MADVLKGISGGWAFLVSWVFPSAISWSAFGLFVYPHLTGLPVFKEISTTTESNQEIVLAGLSLATAILLSASSTVLFRMLEGYKLMPERLAVRLRKRQLRTRAALQQKLALLRDLRKAEVDAAEVGPDKEVHESQTGVDVRIGLVAEELRRFPADARQFGPTRFSNALRAIETYGWDRYFLDSQTLWSELQGVIPDGLKDEQDRARAPVNFFVSLLYLSCFETVVCLATALLQTTDRLALVAVGVISAVLVPMWYRLAISNTRNLLAVMQATVNIGRVRLAAEMGLVIPVKLNDERDMWHRVYWFVHDPYDATYSADLDKYRRNDSSLHRPCNTSRTRRRGLAGLR